MDPQFSLTHVKNFLRVDEEFEAQRDKMLSRAYRKTTLEDVRVPPGKLMSLLVTCPPPAPGEHLAARSLYHQPPVLFCPSLSPSVLEMLGHSTPPPALS